MVRVKFAPEGASLTAWTLNVIDLGVLMLAEPAIAVLPLSWSWKLTVKPPVGLPAVFLLAVGLNCRLPEVRSPTGIVAGKVLTVFPLSMIVPLTTLLMMMFCR